MKEIKFVDAGIINKNNSEFIVALSYTLDAMYDKFSKEYLNISKVLGYASFDGIIYPVKVVIDDNPMFMLQIFKKDIISEVYISDYLMKDSQLCRDNNFLLVTILIQIMKIKYPNDINKQNEELHKVVCTYDLIEYINVFNKAVDCTVDLSPRDRKTIEYSRACKCRKKFKDMIGDFYCDIPSETFEKMTFKYDDPDFDEEW